MITAADMISLIGGGFFFAFLGLTRVALNLGFTHHPLFAAAIWGFLTWQAQPALSIGIFFELLWLDLFPAGTFIPPNATFSLLVSLTLLACLPDPDMRLIALVLICSVPLAYLSAWIEQRYRRRQNLSYNSLITWTRNQKRPFWFSPKNLTRLALIEIFTLNLGFFFLCLIPLLLFFRSVRPWIELGPQPTWPMLWAIACLGALLSLRTRKAYILATLSIMVGVLVTM